MIQIRSTPASNPAAARTGKPTDTQTETPPEAARQASCILSCHIDFRKHPVETDGKYVDPVKWGDS